MASKDNIYYFDKVSPYEKHLYGEIQQNSFNMSFVIDGTKDSTKIIVINFVREELKPNTIVYLEKTNTWWIVDKDRVEKHTYENHDIYRHELQLLGAIDILSSRDLTNCGFNRERYTIEQMFNRLFSLSDFEFSVSYDWNYVLNKDTKYNYVKTFDNYTPLSAIRELCDEFNCVPKMSFVVSNNKISSAKITFFSKSGLANSETNINTFTDSRELITNSKDNYGTRVISNVENCISSVAVDYPSVGAGRLTSEENKITRTNAIFRLPSKAFKVNSITFSGRFKVYIKEPNQTGAETYTDINNSILNYGVVDKVRDIFLQNATTYDIKRYDNNYDLIKSRLIDALTITIKNGGYYDWDNDTWVGNYTLLHSNTATLSHGFYPPITLNTKKMALTNKQNWRTITWEQGSDIISNFIFFDELTNGYLDFGVVDRYTYKEIRDKNNGIITRVLIYTDGQTGKQLWVETCQIDCLGDYRCWVNVNYIPMHDIKIKIDNNELGNDTHIFNQNGKLIDGSSVSKLISAYANVINSNEITRYKTYYSFNDIPKVGTIIIDNGVKYVVNNLSIDFSPNDNDNYIYYCEFTMTKQNACKSAMIQANSNIRDYKCPQENNIKRIQLYRDYIELGYSSENTQSYMNLSKIFVFERYSKCKQPIHNVLVRVKDSYFTLNSGNYYFKLFSSKVYLDKMYVELIDFVDNNIIGYDYTSVWKAWNVDKWWQFTDYLNVPISYVDDYGEIDGLELLFVNNDQMYELYNEYATTKTDTSVEDLSKIQLVISKDMFDMAKNKNLYDINILENNYKKDGLEIPVFQYNCQVGNANGIVLGVDFLKEENCEDNEFIEYTYFISDKEITNENYGLLNDSLIAQLTTTTYRVRKRAKLTYSNNQLKIKFFIDFKANVGDGSSNYILLDTSSKLNKNIGLVCNVCQYDSDTQLISVKKSYLLFAINNCQVNVDSDKELTLYVNNWKLR